MSKTKDDKKKNNTTVKTSGKENPREYETMSQQQNRHGNGRQQNGSDGSGVKGRGSNH